MFVGRRRLARIDRHLDRGDGLMEGMREELRLMREALRKMDERQEAMFERQEAQFERHHEAIRREFELNRREHRETRSAVQNLREVCRVLVLRVEENTQVLRELRSDIRAQTQGLMHVLDELRGRGPGGEPATS